MRLTFRTLCVALALLFGAGAAEAQALGPIVAQYPVLYGAPGGVNNKTCDIVNPCGSIAWMVNQYARYNVVGTRPTIQLAPGTYACPGVISGGMVGNFNAGGGARYLYIVGSLDPVTGRPNVTIGPAGSSVCTATSYASGVVFQDVTVDSGTAGVAIFSQNSSVTELINVEFTGTSVAMHAEASGLVEAEANPSNHLWIANNIGQFFTGGDGGGYLELDPGDSGSGTGGTVTCEAGFTAIGLEFLFLDQGAHVLIGPNWVASGCGSVTGTQFIAGRNAQITNCGNSACTSVAMTIPGTSGAIYRVLEQGARYEPATLPSVIGSTGLGNGTAVVTPGSGPYGGTVTITAGSTTLASGYITLSFGEVLLMGGVAAGRTCGYENGTGTWLATVLACQVGSGSGAGGIEMLWNDNGTNLSSGSTYKLDYIENGDQ